MGKDTSNPLEVRSNGTVDDIAAVIGFTATLRLVAWFSDHYSPLYVPREATEDHEIARLIGAPAFRRLVSEWGNEHLSISPLQFYEDDRRNRIVRDLLKKGMTPREITRVTPLSPRRIEQLRGHLEEAGMLRVPAKNPGEKPR